MLRWLRVTLTIGLLGSVGFIGTVALRRPAVPAAMAAEPRASRRPVNRMDRNSAEGAAAALVGLAPFRANRTPGPAETAVGQSASSAPTPIRPALIVTAIGWGPRPAAVLEGLPGVDGARLVVEGDTIGGLRVRSIRPEQVVVTAPDTVWVLRVGGTKP